MSEDAATAIADEADRLLALGREQGVALRLLGGLAIHRHVEGDLHPAFARACKDIDFIVPRGAGAPAAELIVSAGYDPHDMFNAVNSGRRALFFSRRHGWQVDVFVGAFEMCHRIPVADRLELERDTMPLAELLLTKLQVVELNRKDLGDALALLHGHAVADHDDDAVNADVIAARCAEDWGLWRTCQLNLERLAEGLGSFEFSEPERAVIRERLDAVWTAIDAWPKGRRWRARNLVGDRKRWYLEPEEPEEDDAGGHAAGATSAPGPA